MCGISGFFHFDRGREASQQVIKKMNDTIVHRGPDGEGFYVKNNVALGHRRLAIIDLCTGEQPMYSSDKQIVLVFNGEIYNYVELKKELEDLGNVFSTGSDTEVIINAYRTWGVDCQKHFNGMWAFALWDVALQQLFISRDRIGEKPLYYSKHDNSFIFGSEIKAVLAYGVPKKQRTDVTELYLTLSFVPAPYTFFQDVYQLMPGKYFLINENGVKEQTYWDLPDISEKDMVKDKAFVEKEFEKLFNDSIKIRMRSDVGFGAFLSGGLDSSCIVSTMNNFTSKPVETFTIGFENKQYDERHLAKLVADKFKTSHHESMVTSENFDEVLEKVLYHYDEPFGDASAIPTGQVSKYASAYVKMVLTGDGGDEVLSGYTIYQGEGFAKKYQRLPSVIKKILPALAKTAAIPLRGNLRYRLNRISKVLELSNQPFEKRLQSKLSYVNPESLSKIISPGSQSISFLDFYNEVMKPCRFKDPFYKLMYFHHKVTLPGDMLTKVDRMSMAHSLETRAPFLDHRIIELLFSTDQKLKTSTRLNKLILRNAIANRSLPGELLGARKKGFGVPLRDWFKETSLNSKIRDYLLAVDTPVFNAEATHRLIDENMQGKSDFGNFIWVLIVLKKWLNNNTNNL